MKLFPWPVWAALFVVGFVALVGNLWNHNVFGCAVSLVPVAEGIFLGARSYRYRDPETGYDVRFIRPGKVDATR